MPVLSAHVIKGHPVLPMALIVDGWPTRPARQSGARVSWVRRDGGSQGRYSADDQPVHLRVLTGKAIKDDGFYRVPVELRGTLSSGREVRMPARKSSWPQGCRRSARRHGSLPCPCTHLGKGHLRQAAFPRQGVGRASSRWKDAARTELSPPWPVLPPRPCGSSSRCEAPGWPTLWCSTALFR